jgi:hypothetical protein
MNSKISQFRVLKELEKKARAAIPALEAKFAELEAGQAGLDEATIRAEALEAKDAPKKGEIAAANKEAAARLRGELEQGKRRVAIIEAEAEKIKGQAITELRDDALPRYVEAIKIVAQKAKELLAVEQQAMKIRHDLRDTAQEIARIPSDDLLPFIRPLCLGIAGKGPDPYVLFLGNCRDAGIDVD